MKKVYDWNIDVIFRVPKFQKDIQIKGLSVHTFFKELQIQICQNLGLNPLSAAISFYIPGIQLPLKLQSTLYQHHIKSNDVLICNIVGTLNQVISPSVYMQEQQLFDMSELEDYNPKKVAVLVGLVIKGFCSRRDCLDYNKQRNVALGYGVFDLNDLLNHRECQHCGSKKFVIKDLVVSNCNWKYSGRYRNYDGTVRSESTQTFEKIISTDYSKNIYSLILQRRWVELALMVKQL